MTTVKGDSGIRYRTEDTVRLFWGYLYGDQQRLIRFIVDQGGAARYADIKKQTSLEKQSIAGVLSSITRNAKKATRYEKANLVNWRIGANGEESFIDTDGLPHLTKLVH